MPTCVSVPTEKGTESVESIVLCQVVWETKPLCDSSPWLEQQSWEDYYTERMKCYHLRGDDDDDPVGEFEEEVFFFLPLFQKRWW